MVPVAEAPRGTGAGRLTEEELLSALPARSAKREVRVGAFVLVGILAFLTILFTMTDVGTFRGRYYTNTVLQNAGGMRRGDPVQMRGVNIGRVIDFDMVPNGVAVKMEIYDEYRIPSDSRAEVKSSGLLGGMVVNVIPGRSAEGIKDDSTIPGGAAPGVFDQVAGIGTRADTALTRVNQILSRQTVGAVSTSAVELQGLLAELNTIATQQRAELATLSASLRRSASGVEQATTGPELRRSIQQIDALTAQLDETTRTLNQTSTSLQTVIGRVERGEGTLGRLTTDEELYTNLNTAATNLNALLTDIRSNPKKYFDVRVF